MRFPQPFVHRSSEYISEAKVSYSPEYIINLPAPSVRASHQAEEALTTLLGELEEIVLQGVQRGA